MLKLKSLLINNLKNKKSFSLILIILVGISIQFVRHFQQIKNYPVTSWYKSPQADCALVLTGGPGRVREGFDLLSNHRVKKLIISGVYANTQLRDLLPLWSFYGDLKSEDVVLERKSESTYGNAQQSEPIVEALHCRDIVLVTSRLHMWRAYQTVRSVIPEHVQVQAHAIVAGRLEPSFWDLFIETCKSVFYSYWAY